MLQFFRNFPGKRFLLKFSLFILMISVSSCQVDQQPTASPTTPPSLSPTRETPTETATSPVGETIAMIQGAGHISPYRNKAVTNVEGIVTVVKFDGFYLQSLKPDDDLATSEGIFVFTDLVPSVKVGDVVVFDGQVAELLSLIHI